MKVPDEGLFADLERKVNVQDGSSQNWAGCCRVRAGHCHLEPLWKASFKMGIHNCLAVHLGKSWVSLTWCARPRCTDCLVI